jgi:hypothetical protein
VRDSKVTTTVKKEPEAFHFRRHHEDPQKAAFITWRRDKRNAIAERGDITIWGVSPRGNIPKYSDDSSEEETPEERKARKKRKKEKKRAKKAKKKAKKKTKKESSNEESGSSEEEWVELTKDGAEAAAAEQEKEFIGPKLPDMDSDQAGENEKRVDYGKDLLPGEGAAMAAFIADGKRIPRRGEIGLTSGEIDVYEQAGYVMSGTRHRRMEATRLRKESQIYSAEEKRMLSNFTKDQRDKKESLILSQFRSLVTKKMGGGQGSE